MEWIKPEARKVPVGIIADSVIALILIRQCPAIGIKKSLFDTTLKEASSRNGCYYGHMQERITYLVFRGYIRKKT
jgi:hypothetical protein